MKNLFLLGLLVVVSCKTSTGPLPAGDGPAVLPTAGRQYVYSYTGVDTAGRTTQLSETVAIVSSSDSTSSQRFIANRISDTANNFWTTASDAYIVLPDGDLQRDCGCDNYIYPIQTQRTYAATTTTPAKQHGAEFTATVTTEFSYLGAETITIAGQSFDCSKVQVRVVLAPDHSIPEIETVTVTDIYWYSSKLGYFVKEQYQATPLIVGQNYTRTLISFN